MKTRRMVDDYFEYLLAGIALIDQAEKQGLMPGPPEGPQMAMIVPPWMYKWWIERLKQELSR